MRPGQKQSNLHRYFALLRTLLGRRKRPDWDWTSVFQIERSKQFFTLVSRRRVPKREMTRFYIVANVSVEIPSMGSLVTELVPSRPYIGAGKLQTPTFFFLMKVKTRRKTKYFLLVSLYHNGIVYLNNDNTLICGTRRKWGRLGNTVYCRPS